CLTKTRIVWYCSGRLGRLIAGAFSTMEQIGKALVTTNFFRLMGAKIAFGRDFTEADGVPQPARPEVLIPPGSAAILSYEYWQRLYGGSTSVLGQEMVSAGQRGRQQTAEI